MIRYIYKKIRYTSLINKNKCMLQNTKPGRNNCEPISPDLEKNLEVKLLKNV